MNLKPGGKQGRLRDSIIPSDNPCIPTHLRGQVQSFYFKDSHADPQLVSGPMSRRAGLSEQFSDLAARQEVGLSCPSRCSRLSDKPVRPLVGRPGPRTARTGRPDDSSDRPSEQLVPAVKPKLNFQCSTCTSSNIAKDAAQQSAKLNQQANGNGYYLTPEQHINQSSTSLPSESIPEVHNPTTNNINLSCCWPKIMVMQSDFVNK
ncbi:hypothetical protein PSTG_03148 [Puccinia striiformis f. sp. tritici PST-78]|uniref:Uncharacterized protein n=1 Tax=Puccinia striiformis f. sp. tritici PST-78 TaxID=1165861 RepID=A0A0L0VWH8_9BASI|nr:hypothetical protein PSTG_03148 [Puccinia striiformis f. sp. tritici PST-78]